MPILKSFQPRLIIHGGAGIFESRAFSRRQYHDALREVAAVSFRVLKRKSAHEAVLDAVTRMEDHPIFNAGVGSKLQRDGEVRMSAALMADQKFSGVINIRNVKNPVQVANLLARSRYAVLCGNEATAYARQHKMEHFDPVTEHRIRELMKKSGIKKSGTVGAVALDKRGRIVAATSTGGLGNEIPGRVADSATVAGNYASRVCGVSCTGRGEHIVNRAVAARIVIRVESGLPLEEAGSEVVRHARQHNLRIGFIALDRGGNFFVGNGFEAHVLFAFHDGKAVKTFFNHPAGGIPVSPA